MKDAIKTRFYGFSPRKYDAEFCEHCIYYKRYETIHIPAVHHHCNIGDKPEQRCPIVEYDRWKQLEFKNL